MKINVTNLYSKTDFEVKCINGEKTKSAEPTGTETRGVQTKVLHHKVCSSVTLTTEPCQWISKIPTEETLDTYLLCEHEVKNFDFTFGIFSSQRAQFLHRNGGPAGRPLQSIT